jgi:Kef-type K+ transport system membrane component KefB
MRRRTARILTLVIGIVLTLCGLGYCGAQFIQGGPPDAVRLAFGIAMTVVGVIVIVASARGLRHVRVVVEHADGTRADAPGRHEQ